MLHSRGLHPRVAATWADSFDEKEEARQSRKVGEKAGCRVSDRICLKMVKDKVVWLAPNTTVPSQHGLSASVESNRYLLCTCAFLSMRTCHVATNKICLTAIVLRVPWLGSRGCPPRVRHCSGLSRARALVTTNVHVRHGPGCVRKLWLMGSTKTSRP